LADCLIAFVENKLLEVAGLVKNVNGELFKFEVMYSKRFYI